MLRPASHLRDTDPAAPHHLLLGPDTHGVTRYAGEVADAARAPVVRDVAQLAPGAAVHLHLTDRLLGRDPLDAAAVVEQLARRVRLTVTLHDVPQPTDGPVFAARAAAYGRIVRASHAWATNSWHEHDLVDRWSASGARGTVIPLPVPVPAGFDGQPGRPGRAVVGAVATEPVVGVFGFVYPGKGHRQVVRAVAALRRAGTMASVRVLGDAAPGHADEIEALVRTSRDRGVPVEVTGRVPEDDLVSALRGVAVRRDCAPQRLRFRQPQLLDRRGTPAPRARRCLHPGDGGTPPRHPQPLRRRDPGALPRRRAAPTDLDLDLTRRRPRAAARGHGSRLPGVVGDGRMTTPPYGTSVPGNRWDLAPTPPVAGGCRWWSPTSSSRTSSTARSRPCAARRSRRTRSSSPTTGRRGRPRSRPACGWCGSTTTASGRPPRATSACRPAPASCWCCSTPTPLPSRASWSAWSRSPRRCPEALVVGRRRHADLAGTVVGAADRAGCAAARAARARLAARHVRRQPRPAGRRRQQPPLRHQRRPGLQPVVVRRGRRLRRDASAPTAGRTGTSPTGRGPRAACWRTAPTPSPGTTGPTRARGSATLPRSWPRPSPSRTARPRRSTTWRGLARGPADLVVTCAPALADAELLVTVDSLLAALPRAVVRLSERHRDLVGADPRVVAADADLPASARLHLDVRRGLLGDAGAWVALLDALDGARRPARSATAAPSCRTCASCAAPRAGVAPTWLRRDRRSTRRSSPGPRTSPSRRGSAAGPAHPGHARRVRRRRGKEAHP